MSRRGSQRRAQTRCRLRRLETVGYEDAANRRLQSVSTRLQARAGSSADASGCRGASLIHGPAGPDVHSVSRVPRRGEPASSEDVPQRESTGLRRSRTVHLRRAHRRVSARRPSLSSAPIPPVCPRAFTQREVELPRRSPHPPVKYEVPSGSPPSAGRGARAAPRAGGHGPSGRPGRRRATAGERPELQGM